MMRSLWTAASGMQAQQLNIDTISNNIANVNTTSYKKTNIEFKDLLYETMKSPVKDKDGNGNPVPLQVGHGVRSSATSRDYGTGNLQETSNKLDFAIQGEGFFTIKRPTGDFKYTKDGAFKVSPFEDELYVTTSEGYQVMSDEDEPIILPPEAKVSSLTCDEEGNLGYKDLDGNIVPLEQKIKLVQFTNVGGLETIGGNLYQETAASGMQILEADLPQIDRSVLRQGCIEASNVQIADEMVNMIVAQRAYELNSKAIQTSDDMLSIANQLKR